METLKEKTAKGLLWGGMNNVVLQVVGLAFGIVLGRTLHAEDFGMMAMLSIFSLIATSLQDSGFKTALTNLDHPTHRDYNAVFWFNILVGGSIYLFLFFSAPLIGAFYGNERLVPLCRYAFLSIVIASFGTSQSAWLFKNLRVRQQAKAGMLAVVVSSTVGVAMALGGCAYWSLATQGLVYVGINTLMLWHYSAWRPSLHWDFTPVRRMFRFSCKILATTITLHINNNVLNILLGRFFGERQAGFYNQAYQWDFKCFSVVQGMVNQVAQPVLVEMRGDDGRQLNALRKLMRFTAFITFPLLLGFALVAKEFIVLAVTERWLPSVPLLQMLCLSGAVMPLSTLLSNAVVASGRSGTYFHCTLALCISQLLLMVAVHPLGIKAMVIGYVLLNILWLPVWHSRVSLLMGYRFLHLLADVLPFALAAAAVMAITGFITSFIPQLPWLQSWPALALWLLLISRVAVAALLYFMVMRMAKTEILNECITFLKLKMKHEK